MLFRQQLLPRLHARYLLPMVHSVLEEAKLTLQGLDVLACSHGPGSFTGVRLACTMIQAFSFGLKIPVVAISTLRAMAQGAARKRGIKQTLVTLNAGNQEVYWGLFKLGHLGSMESFQEEKIEIQDKIVLPPGDWAVYSEFPEAQDVAYLAGLEYQAGNIISPERITPVYLKSEFVKKMAE